MKSIQIEKFGGPEVLVYKDVEIKKPGPKEVLIKNLSIGLNFIDIYHRTGLYPIPASDGAGVKLKRSIGVEPNYFDPFLMLDEFGSENSEDYIAGCLLYTSPSPRDRG